MLDSVNRVGGNSIDWSQVIGNKKTSAKEYNYSLQPSNTNTSSNQTSEYDQEKLNKEIEKVNAQLASLNHSLRMRFSEEAEQFYVEVIDVRTQEVIDSIPGKYMIDLAAKLKDMIGFFIDEKR